MDINSQKNSNNMPSPLAPRNGNDSGKDTPSSQEATAVSVATSSADSIVPQLPSTIDCSPIENDNENNKRKREIDQSTKDSASDKANASSSAKAADGVIPPAKRTRRGTAFNAEEILLLAKAWESTSTNEARGTDQSQESFWRRVMTAFVELKIAAAASTGKSYPSRDVESIKKFWSVANKALAMFVGIVSTNPPKSGEQDKRKYYNDIVAMYAARAQVKGDARLPTTFDRFLPAYLWLKKQPKFTTLHMTLGKDVSSRGTKKTKLHQRPRGRDMAKLDKKSRDAATVVLRNIEVCVCVMILLPVVYCKSYHISYQSYHIISLVYALLYSMLILLV